MSWHEVLVQHDQEGGEDGEEGTETKHDEVSNGLAQWGLSSEEAGLSSKLRERWRLNFNHGEEFVLRMFQRC